MEKIKEYQHQGVTFYDIAPLLQDGPSFMKVISDLHTMFMFDFDMTKTTIVALESRGFIIGSALSMTTYPGKDLVMARKPGKLPGEVISVTYEKEYGTDTLEVQKDVLNGKKVLIVDDILATGGSLKAARELMEKAGAEVVGFACLLGLKKFEKDWPTDIPLYILERR